MFCISKKRLPYNGFLPKRAVRLTLTVYPDPDPETATVDGQATRSGVDQTFANIIAGAGTTFTDDGTGITPLIVGSTTTDQFSQLRRSIILFDTSSLGASAAISAATFSLYGTGKSNGLGSPDLHICASTPASNTALAATDYSQLGSTSFGSVTYAAFSTVAYNDITLDANGRNNVSKTGISKFGAKNSWDMNSSFTGAWASSALSDTSSSAAETAGTTQDPKLVVTYTVATFIPLIIMT